MYFSYHCHKLFVLKRFDLTSVVEPQVSSIQTRSCSRRKMEEAQVKKIGVDEPEHQADTLRPSNSNGQETNETNGLLKDILLELRGISKELKCHDRRLDDLKRKDQSSVDDGTCNDNVVNNLFLCFSVSLICFIYCRILRKMPKLLVKFLSILLEKLSGYMRKTW